MSIHTSVGDKGGNQMEQTLVEVWLKQNNRSFDFLFFTLGGKKESLRFKK